MVPALAARLNPSYDCDQNQNIALHDFSLFKWGRHGLPDLVNEFQPRDCRVGTERDW